MHATLLLPAVTSLLTCVFLTWRLLDLVPHLARAYLAQSPSTCSLTPPPTLSQDESCRALCDLRAAGAFGSCWAATFLAFAPHPVGALLAPLLTLSPALAWIDAHSRKLPDVLTAPLWASQPLLLLALTAGKDTLCGDQFLGAIGVGVPGGGAGAGTPSTCLGTASWAWVTTVTLGVLLVFGLRAMGLGDVKLAAPIAASLAFLSPALSLTWLLVSGILGGIGAAVALGRRRVSWRGHIPLGPYLLISLGLVTTSFAPK